jgi:hypothetical protein
MIRRLVIVLLVAGCLTLVFAGPALAMPPSGWPPPQSAPVDPVGPPPWPIEAPPYDPPPVDPVGEQPCFPIEAPPEHPPPVNPVGPP